ncbi:bifunctional 2-polyprenyl-6-hydroxyphenol methylase/3-demethylubiquinol 3-O-methyltransferase UbiG [Streptomyces sp. NRRL S-87]|uniref:class I SAM-dependent methyltransferase n=1 Tax=Streptomyces sp. NRRL S-87 TaxID=1463920 RepID=UPI0004C0B41E|nr:class I SAM-dependent methyltransferase [Streptomyces sp. NRRL S-87]
MPTLASGEPDPTPQPHGSHRRRDVAESFGDDAERYERARPRYPDALVARVTAAAAAGRVPPAAAPAGTAPPPGSSGPACSGPAGSGPAGAPPAVLDVGSGTGIAARQFRAAGCRVLGVEPDARMAAVAERLGVRTETATFEEWDPAGRTFDAVVAAQAWHWIDPAAGAAKAAAVLRPGGRFAAFWNALRLPPAAAEAFGAVYARLLPDLPFDPRALTDQGEQAYAKVLDRTVEGLGAAGSFGPPERGRDAWEWTYTREAWLDQLPTLGAFTRLPADRLAGLLDAVGTAVDALGGSFTARYTTVSVTAARLR